MNNLFLFKDRTYWFLFIFLMLKLSFSQGPIVSSYQKINEIYGGLPVDLDAGDHWGVSMDFIGDLDGNGVTDLAVGAYTDDDGGSNIGAVWILFLDENDFTIGHTKISATSGNFNGVLDIDDRFGGAVSYLGDLNDDGLIELAVGADYDSDGGHWHGAVWILSLNNDGTVNSHVKISDTFGNFNGQIDDYAIFGTDIENIGDLNGDGIEDLAVGARRSGGLGISKGAVWILFMNADFTVSSHQKIAHNTGGFGSLDDEDYFGGSVANIGDLNGDGLNELAVGAYRDDDQFLNSGSFYVLFLNNNGTVTNSQKISNLAGGFEGSINEDALFGESIDGVTDIDEDGKIEIVVGALRHTNPTSSQNTGGFYLIELNADGTVSEFYLYTEGEYCFNGSLAPLDYFGGSVSIIQTSPETLKVATGAYKDDDTGTDSGSIWILNLERTAMLESEAYDPTMCSAVDGEIIIYGVPPETTYEVNYLLNGIAYSMTVISDIDNYLLMTLLDNGAYTDISITEQGTNCTYHVEDAFLQGQGFEPAFEATNTNGCNANNGILAFSDLIPGLSYNVLYTHEGEVVSVYYTASADGSVEVEGLSAGVYMNVQIIEPQYNCMKVFGDVTLDGIGFTIGDVLLSDATNCEDPDGELMITGLAVEANYEIAWMYQSAPNTVNVLTDANGVAEMTNLSSGMYETIVITELSSGCTNTIENFSINTLDFEVTFEVIDVSDCNDSNGAMNFTNLSSNANYEVSFEFQGTAEQLLLNSNAEGALSIANLASGIYSNVVITDLQTHCTNQIGTVTIEAFVFEVFITMQDPTACDLNDGHIRITNLQPGELYEISYQHEFTTEVQTYVASSTGAIIIDNLGIGSYLELQVLELASNCSHEFGEIVLSGADLEVSTSTVNLSSCEASDGIIQFMELQPGSPYSVSYQFNGNTVVGAYEANQNGDISLNQLAGGVYELISITSLEEPNCSLSLGSLELWCEPIEENDDCLKTMPFFTPNNDGDNDLWHVQMRSSNCQLIEVKIFDRYGKQLSRLDANLMGWDGTYNGKRLPSNDYWYVVDYYDGLIHKTYRSHFALVR